MLILFYFIFYTILHNYLLAPWSRVLLEKLTGSQLAPFYGTHSFITAFTSACHLPYPEPVPVDQPRSEAPVYLS
jgi:hypothetical protein